MARRYVNWSATDVKKWAREYLKKRETLDSLEKRLGASHSTIWWSFVNRLEAIDPNLYIDVMTKLIANKHLGGRRR